MGYRAGDDPAEEQHVGIKGTIAKQVGGAAADRAFDELADRLAGATRSTIEQVVRTRGPAIAADADLFRLKHPELTGAPLDRGYIRDRARRLGGAGVVTGLPSVVPGVGTAVEIAAAAADAAALTYGQVSLVLGLSHLHGRDVTDLDARRLDVLMVLGLDAGLVEREGTVLKAVGHEIPLASLSRKDLPDAVIGRLNRSMGERVVSRIANRRAKSLLGRLLPFGLGVVVAGSADYRAAASVGKAAQTYFDWLENARVDVPSAIR